MKNSGTLGMFGSYNKISRIQLSFIEWSIPYLKESIENLEMNCSLFPIILADYGSLPGLPNRIFRNQ